MDFSTIFQLRTKKFWWMDVIFYFAISLLISTVFCYLIFLVKNNFQREDIKIQTEALQTVGTGQQKEYENIVIGYRKKINDFGNILKNHQFGSNVLTFMEAQTMPSIWFNQFSLDEKGGKVQLSGEAENIDAFSRQVSVFERNKYVKDMGGLSSTLGNSARITFSMDLLLDQNILSYLSVSSVLEAVTSSDSPIITPSPGSENTNPPAGGVMSGENLITSFSFLLNPEVSGQIDKTNHTVTLSVPYGTDVEKLTPSIIISPGATVLPVSNVLQDFTSPIVYRVTAQDGSIQAYMATVVVSAPSGFQKDSWQSMIIIVVIAVAGVIATALIFLLVRRMRKQKEKIQQ